VIEGAFILLYHRVAEATTDPWQLCVSPRHFGEQLEVLRRQARVVSLRHLIEAIGTGGSLAGTVAITFDDGYADNLAAARTLERYGMPATVFITTGYIDGDREFWWDELDRVLLQPGELPRSLTVDVDGQRHTVEIGEAAHYPASAAVEYGRWRAYDDDPPGPRQAAYLDLWERLSARPAAQQRRVLDQLLRQANGASSTMRPSHRPMSQRELCEMASLPLVEIGAHTVTHPKLDAHPPAVQEHEIVRGKQDLESWIGRPVAGFSYPHGRFDQTTLRLVREAGFGYACAVHGTASRNLLRIDPDRYRFPRVMVLDWDGETFERMLLNDFEG
jgi:peptidoglycan/xylan/chitin deacetylase (PgdA/CDA1 family)